MQVFGGEVSRFGDGNGIDGQPITMSALRIGQRRHQIRRHIAVGEDPIGRGQALGVRSQQIGCETIQDRHVGETQGELAFRVQDRRIGRRLAAGNPDHAAGSDPDRREAPDEGPAVIVVADQGDQGNRRAETSEVLGDIACDPTETATPCDRIRCAGYEGTAEPVGSVHRRGADAEDRSGSEAGLASVAARQC